MKRSIAIISHPEHPEHAQMLLAVERELAAAGIRVVAHPTLESVGECELILVLGGDGTVLRAAELGRPTGIPILGINYGHMGFLNEAEPEDIPAVITHLIERSWSTEARMTIDVEVQRPDGMISRGWALNEVSIEKDTHVRIIEVSIGVDGRELSSFKVDNVLFSTSTGSTAYNFSAGGPIVWPDVQAMVLTPIAAHALFTRPLVIGASSTLHVRVRSDDAILWCDGRRSIAAPQGSLVRAVKGRKPVILARLSPSPFSQRLVTKFQLPVKGWRGEGPNRRTPEKSLRND